MNKLRKVTRIDRKALRKDKKVEKAALVVNTRTCVDVLWQDGTRSSKVNSCSLGPVEHLGDHEIWPEQYVLEQGPDGDDLDNEVRRMENLVKPVPRPEDLREFGEEETVSVYELIGHPDYAYCLGDVVIYLSPAPCGVSELTAELSEASSVEEQMLKNMIWMSLRKGGEGATFIVAVKKEKEDRWLFREYSGPVLGCHYHKLETVEILTKV